MSRYKAIIFDFDNTLVATQDYFFEYVRNYLKDHPYKDYSLEQFIDEAINYGGSIEPDTLKAFWSKYREHQHLMVKPYPEDGQALAQFKELGLKMAIISRSDNGKIEGILNTNNLLNTFSPIVGSAEKPDRRYLIDCIEQLSVKKDEVLYVGDDQEDIEMGINASVDTAYILRSDGRSKDNYQKSKEWLDANKPNYMISSLLEIVDILGM